MDKEGPLNSIIAQIVREAKQRTRLGAHNYQLEAFNLILVAVGTAQQNTPMNSKSRQDRAKVNRED